MNKIVVSTLVWKRPEVFDAFCRNMISLVPKPIVVIAGSPFDGCQDIAEKYGFEYVSTQNRLLGQKANLSAQLADKYEPDYIMLTGSDDLISQSMWEYYCNFKGEVLGLRDYLFYNVPDGRLIYWGGYQGSMREGYPIGANKLIRRDIMDKLHWLPYSTKSHHPDEFDTDLQLKKLGIKTKIVTMAETGGLSLDIKTEASITKFKLWKNCKYVNLDQTFQNEQELLEIIKSIPKLPWETPKKPRRRH